MTKPISKSKRQLAQLLIEAGVTQFPEGANWAAQDKKWSQYAKCVMFYRGADKPVVCKGDTSWRPFGDDSFLLNNVEPVALTSLIPNWHQTVLSRDEFDQIVAETAEENLDLDQYVKDYPMPVGDDETNLAAKGELEALEFTTSPTLDQLLQDWRNADDYAQRKQTEADEAAAMRDERWQAVQDRAGEMGVTVGRCESDDGWIEWGGGECPVGEEQLVRIKVRGETGAARGKAGHWSWGHSGCCSDIVAYRLAHP